MNHVYTKIELKIIDTLKKCINKEIGTVKDRLKIALHFFVLQIKKGD